MHRLGEVQAVLRNASPAAPRERSQVTVDTAFDEEEQLRVVMVRLLPRGDSSPKDCVELVRQVAQLQPMAEHDVRALDAWHNAFERASLVGFPRLGEEGALFLAEYAELLERWIDRAA
jgi:hypothetical protein